MPVTMQASPPTLVLVGRMATEARVSAGLSVSMLVMQTASAVELPYRVMQVS